MQSMVNNAFIVWSMIHVEKNNVDMGLKIQELQAGTTTTMNEWTLFLMCPVLLPAWNNSPAQSQPQQTLHATSAGPMIKLRKQFWSGSVIPLLRGCKCSSQRCAEMCAVCIPRRRPKINKKNHQC